jgi:methionine--tRNA ligase beta chain
MADTTPAAHAPTTTSPTPTDPGAATGPAATPATIVYDDFAKVQLRVATVLEARPAPKGDRLLVLQVDLGDEKRQILAGIRQYVAPEQLVGKQVVVVANLAPRNMMGLTSQGMLLAATDPVTGKVVVVSPTEPVAAGAKVS